MDSINHLLAWLNDNWTSIIILIGLIIGLAQKIRSYLQLSKEEKIAVAKEQISQIVLKLVSDAEEDYEDYNQAGTIKRAQVIEAIYEKFPALTSVMEQTELIAWIDGQIDDALKILRAVLAQQKKEE